MDGIEHGSVIPRTAYRPAEITAPEPWHVRHRGRIAGAVVALAVCAVVAFFATGRSVRIEVTPPDAGVDVDGGLAISLGGTWILRSGTYRVSAQAPGYEVLEAPLVVTDEDQQVAHFALQPLPGRLHVHAQVEGAVVRIDGRDVAKTPVRDLRVAAGKRALEVLHPRYRPYRANVAVEGREIEQTVDVALEPNWATYAIASEPAGATVFVDDVEVGVTPASVDVVAGSRVIRLKRAGFKSWQTRLDVVAGDDRTLTTVRLEAADAILSLASTPSGAGVTVDGRYAGVTPLDLGLAPDREHRVRVSRAGFDSVVRTVQLATAEERALAVVLPPLIGTVIFSIEPGDAEVLLDGVRASPVDRTLRLPARPHRVEVRKAGYVAYEGRITPQPGLTQQLDVRLRTEAEARLAATPASMRHPGGGEMLLLSGGSVQMGASRREPGRRANEVQREARVTRLFYLGVKEVSNAEFRRFAAGHSSGKFEEQDLDDDELPVVNVTWDDAARFCNWLSEQAKLAPFYRVEGGKITGFDSRASGYRLPTEAEWSWAARTAPGRTASQRFPWGDGFPPPDRHGNYADRSASHLVGRVIFGYNDNHIAAAPVGSFAADGRGLYDLSGNVAEWISDFYEIPSAELVTDPLGPASGDYHVILGSSWMHGTVTDLRSAFRDYGTDGRPDLGFRVARFAE